MRISDWSSDVCSSDLTGRYATVEFVPHDGIADHAGHALDRGHVNELALSGSAPMQQRDRRRIRGGSAERGTGVTNVHAGRRFAFMTDQRAEPTERSAEHTSETPVTNEHLV